MKTKPNFAATQQSAIICATKKKKKYITQDKNNNYKNSRKKIACLETIKVCVIFFFTFHSLFTSCV